MKLYRSALMAGLVAIGVGACGDDVQVVEPTPPPPPPLTATMAPASATVAVGNDVVFAVTASGGAAGAQASWTCASSNTGIAAASNAPAGCQATGVAAGGVTITAAVTKGSETLNVGAQLTVTSEEVVVGVPGDPAFVLLTPPTTNDDGKVSGTVSVTVSVDRGDQTLAQVGISVDGEIVDYQSFGGGMMMAPTEDEPAEQVAALFTLSFDSDEYDEMGVPKYMNGDHVLTAGILVEGSMEPVLSNSIPLDFGNEDGVHVTASTPGEPVMNATTGDLWYGGPGSKEFTIGVVPVIFSGGDAVSSVTILGGARAFCGAKAATDSEAPFEFSLECKSSDNPDGDTPAFTLVSGGESNATPTVLNERESIFPIRLDYEGPEAPTFEADPNDRDGGWINGTVDLTGKQVAAAGPRQHLDGWLNYNDKDAANKDTDDHNPATDGVGGYTAQLRYTTTTPSIVDAALAADASSDPTLPAVTKKADEICFIATAVDALGNESDLPAAGTSCVAGADASQVIQAGVDITAPTIEFAGTSPKADARALSSEYQLRVADEKDGSGFSDAPVLARVEIRNAKNKVICGDGDEAKKDLPGNEDLRGNCLNTRDGFEYKSDLKLVTTTGVTSKPTAPAYYTLTAMARDNAGNPSDPPVSRVAVNDTKEPVGLIGGSFDPKKSTYNMIANVTDDFSIRDYYVALDFQTYATAGEVLTRPAVFVVEVVGAVLPGRFRLINPVAVDAYNAATPNKTADGSGAYKSVLALQGTADETGTPLAYSAGANDVEAIAVYSRDQSATGYSRGMGAAADAPGDDDGFPVIDPPRTPGNASAAANAVPVDGEIESFIFNTDEPDYDVTDAIDLKVTVVGYERDAKAAGVLPVPPDATAGAVGVAVAAVKAVPFTKPFARVDFYATSEDDDELRFITSVSGATGRNFDDDIDLDDDGVNDGANGTLADAIDDDEDDKDADNDLTVTAERANADRQVTLFYEATVSAAEFYAAVQDSGKGEYGGGMTPRHIIAIGVSPTGVGLVSRVAPIKIDK